MTWHIGATLGDCASVAPVGWRSPRLHCMGARLGAGAVGGGVGRMAVWAGPGGGAGWRVFVSHTSGLREFPAGGSYVAAVERAISACGHVIVDMADFPAADRVPAELCAERVRECDVYVGVLGTRYGSPVRDRPEGSYTELEFDTAPQGGVARVEVRPGARPRRLGRPRGGSTRTP